MVKFVPKSDKGMLPDVVIYGLLSEEDFGGLMKELPIDWNIDKLYQEYMDKTKAEYSKMIINLSVPSYTFFEWLIFHIMTFSIESTNDNEIVIVERVEDKVYD